jgi:hypothetical protein
MSRWRVIAPCSLPTTRGVAGFEVGYEFSSEDLQEGWTCNVAAHQPLDQAAIALAEAECQRLRQIAASSSEPGSIAGIGPTQRLPF